eukprot:1628911-Rhodomonas_salina.1
MALPGDGGERQKGWKERESGSMFRSGKEAAIVLYVERGRHGKEKSSPLSSFAPAMQSPGGRKEGERVGKEMKREEERAIEALTVRNRKQVLAQDSRGWGQSWWGLPGSSTSNVSTGHRRANECKNSGYLTECLNATPLESFQYGESSPRSA